MTPAKWETLYRQLGRLLAEVPALHSQKRLAQPGQQLWLGRARALVREINDLKLIADFDEAVVMLGRTSGVTLTLSGPSAGTNQGGFRHLMQTLYNALAIAELNAPASAQGAFILAQNAFDAFAAINKVLQSAKDDSFIVDPYLDEAILTEFGGSFSDTISIRLLSDQSTAKASLTPAAKAWVTQHGTTRPLSLRLAPPKTLHDRLIILDKTKAHTLTQSFKDFAKRSPAEIVRADDTAALKIAAYEALWASAQVVV